MAHLYVTTDSFEAETLIEDTPPNQEPKYKYQDIESKDGNNLVKKLGFNPMSSVEFDENVSAKALDGIATKLVKEGLFVALESEGSVRRYIPNDMEFRDELVKLALQKKRSRRFGEDPCCAILIYSNNPDKIRTFHDRFY